MACLIKRIYLVAFNNWKQSDWKTQRTKKRTRLGSGKVRKFLYRGGTTRACEGRLGQKAAGFANSRLRVYILWRRSSTRSAGVGSSAHFFLVTPRVLPVLPVDLECCPLTLRPQKWRRPLCLRTFFILSKSSLSLVSTMFEYTCDQVPSLMHFCLFKNHFGIP